MHNSSRGVNVLVGRSTTGKQDEIADCGVNGRSLTTKKSAEAAWAPFVCFLSLSLSLLL